MAGDGNCELALPCGISGVGDGSGGTGVISFINDATTLGVLFGKEQRCAFRRGEFKKGRRWDDSNASLLPVVRRDGSG
jgi:hypothetical protein